ncbi:heme-binding domain-containing protein [bacterium]|nr:heme-binding domain-containing protein [bacterium]
MKKARTNKFIILVPIVSLCFAIKTLAHNSEHGGHQEQKHETISDSKEQILNKINEEYIAQVKPIFQKSCMNCHGSLTKYPWYHILPGAKQLIDYDVRESKIHLDMTNDFPFGGHGSPIEDLEAIKKVIDKKTMPPFRYRALHWSSALKTEEIKTIYTWIERSSQELETHKDKK